MVDKKKILIIDDDIDLVEAMRVTLESVGFEVIDAQEGNRGLEKLRQEKPDLVLLDVMMAHLDEGFQLAYQIRSEEEIKDTPVVILTAVGNQTGFTFDPNKDEDFLPVQAFLEKPVNPRDLIDTVRQYVRA
ncbi:MAG: response regulator [Candidatus Marinimicrobia bacterium]|nr:response regulator [Candidatus Neomarinimicrobiota bacterium]MCF7902315.1 response regulator [Candidatus Neomarinimicrobiota bacterium]